MSERESIGRRVAAAVLSVVMPGTGHIYRGRLHRGLAWFGALTVLWLTVVWTGRFGFAAVVAGWLLTTIDAAVCRRGVPHPNRVQLGAAGIQLVILLSAMAMVRFYLMEAFRVPSASMVPTMIIGDHFYIDKLATDPAVGDIIVFRQPSTGRDFVMRVVARGGDRIAIKGRTFERNGAALPLGDAAPCHYDDHDQASGRWERREMECAVETLGGHRHQVMFDPADRDASHLDFPRARGELDDLRGPPRFSTLHGDLGPIELDADGRYVVPAGHLFVMGDNRDNSNDSRSWGPVPLGDVKGTAMFVWWSRGPDGLRWGRLGHRID